MKIDLPRTLHDVIIVGSGFGGATMAYALSRAGLKVLLVERGGWPHRDATDWDGRAVLLEGRYKSESPLVIRQRDGEPPAGGLGDDSLGDAAGGEETFPNQIVGGNSIFFGGAALRLRETDFARWPIRYADLEPHYGAAERLLEVHGRAGDDPCEPPRTSAYPHEPPSLTAPARRIFEAARASGYHPFQLPSALNYSGARSPACIRCFTCDGFPCRIGAKNDVTQTALRHADPDFLTVLARTVAARLVARDGRLVALEAIDAESGQPLSLRARAFVVSAGAIGTPALLLRSGLDRFDRSASLGRYLMRHCNGMVGYLFPFRTNPELVNHKQICVSDLYEARRAEDGTAVGVIQDMCMPPPEVVRALGPKGFRLAAMQAAGFIQTLICIAEDEPQAANRVSLTTTTDRWGLPVAVVDHHYTEGDRSRRALLIRAARRILRRAGGIGGKVKMIESFSHAVGSVRMSADEASGALDPDCRFRGLPNLFVVDGSFMPTSGGVNPSLTITANALRVAERLRATFGALPEPDRAPAPAV